ncbi:MAG: IPT/TIG domain-containing protein [Chloroflexi bacterium]|nr:IPT/TIG domain-containing protein [Chloroflexota bacterium]
MRNLTVKRGAFLGVLLLTLMMFMAASAQDTEQPRATSINRVEPRNIQAGAGGTISIYGTGFTEDSVVRLRGFGLLTTTFINTGALTAAIPGNLQAGQYAVEVRDPSGDSQWDRTLNVSAAPVPTSQPQPTNEPPVPQPTNEPAPLPTPPPGEPRLTARGYTVVPGVIKPGDGLSVTFELVNLGNRTAQSIIAALDPAGKFLPSGGIASLTVPDIGPGGTFLVSLSAIGALDLPAGPTVIPIKLTYRDFEGKTYDSSVSFSVNVESVSISTQLTVSEYITTPNPVEPGRAVLVQIVVTNSGTVMAPQALLKIGGTDSILLAGPQGDSFPLGDLEPGDSRTINAELVVRADASAGPQPQAYTLSYQQGAEVKESTGTLTLTVAQAQALEPLLLLESYEVSQSTLKPGDTFTLTAVLANVGTGAVQNLLVTFGSVSEDTSGGSGGSTTTTSSTFAPLGTGGSIFVGSLAAEGGSTTLTQDFIVSGSTKSGVYTLPITLRYPNAKRETVTTALNISLIVVVPPELQFIDVPLPPEIFMGEPVGIGLSFTNIGKSDVNFRSAEVSVENAEVLDGQSVFIGTVKAGEEGSMAATVMATGPGPVVVSVTLNYIDELSQPRSVVRQYETVAVEPPPMPTDDPFLPTPEPVTPEPEPEPTFAEMLGKALLGLLGLGS